MGYMDMAFLWPLLVFCILCTLSPDMTETASSPWELPEWGLLITTTKTVLVPEGVVLRTRDPALDKTFHLDRRQPKGPYNDGSHGEMYPLR